jgi:hypothetical protein
MAEDEYPVFTPLGAATVVDDTRTWVSPGGYTLSGRLWRARSIDAKSMDFVLYTGISKGMGALETAKHLEAFLTPEGLSSKTRHPTGRGSGNAAARRLARTETSRSFAVAQLKTDEASPFVEGSHWNRSSAHKDEDQCDENATGHSPGMAPGDYVTSSFPRIPSHPHCMCYPTSVVPQDVDAVVNDLIAQLHPPAASFEVLDTSQQRLEAAALRAAADGKISLNTAKQHIANGLKGKYDEEHIRATTDYLNLKVDAARAFEHGVALAEREGVIAPAEAADLRAAIYTDKERESVLKALRAKGSALRGPVVPKAPPVAKSPFEDLAAFRKKFKNTAYKKTLQEDYAKWRSISTQAEGRALDGYKDGHYSSINRHLRKGEHAYPDTLVQIDSIDSALAKASTSEPGIVSRGIRFRSGRPPDEWANAVPGDIVTDKGYMSTTTNASTARSFGAGSGNGGMLVEVCVPAGTPALSLLKRAGGSLAHEEELLLQRNLKFKVREIKRPVGAYDSWHMVLEIVL